MVKKALQALPGLLIFLSGLFVVVGWLVKNPAWVTPHLAFRPIIFGSAFLFCFAGIALFCFAFSSRFFRLIQLAVGCVLVLVTALVLSEYLFNVDMGIDRLVDTSWIPLEGPWPGRVPLNTAIGFLVTGVIFVLYYFAARKPVAMMVEFCIFFLFILGILSITGQFLNIPTPYNWLSYIGMSLYSAVAFTLLSICLWYFWRKSIYCKKLYRGREGRKLMLLSGVLLLTICLIAGLSFFASLMNQETHLEKNALNVFPVILFAVVIGLLLLRLEIVPLIQRMVNAEKELSQSNARLKNSEERYALAVRGSNAGLWDFEIGTENIFYSPYLKNMLGYTDSELPDTLQSFMELAHPDDIEKTRDALREHILHHTPYDIEIRLKRKSGEYHWFHAVGQAKWDENGRAVRIAGSISDVTEKKISERRLRMQYAVTQLLSEADNVEDTVSSIARIICTGLQWEYGAIWLVNSEKKQLENLGIWHEENQEIARFFENRKKLVFSSDIGLIGRVWSTRKPYWSSDIINDPVFVQREDARNANLYSGFYFPMILQNTVFGVMEFYSHEIESPDENLLQMMAAIGPQISQFIQRKYVEDELRQSETHKSAILNSATDSIITISDTGSIVSLNLQTEKMFGFSRAELKEKNINDLVPGLVDRLGEIVNRLPVEFLAVKKRGDHFPAELAVSGMKINQKDILLIIVRDITERKKVEKLKNEFVSVVSHELRTPLTSIRGSLGLVLGGVVGQFSGKAKNLLEIASNNCERLLHLINDILDVEKIESGKMSFRMEPVDIEKIVQESISANQMYGEKFGVKIHLVDSVSGVLVNVDSDRMLQVMANLISNAVKFSKQGDSVHVSIKVLNQKVRVTVTDFGEGIPENFQPMIFQKFSQADTTTTRGKGGTGLGLNITKSIIEKFGGTIDFSSKKSRGTAFYFDLPVYAAGAQIKNVLDNNETASAKKSLLVCEDDEDQAQYIKAMLESKGFLVDIAMTVHDAKNLVLKNDYQGLLLDLILPDQDGISFIRELRAEPKTRELPIIVMSMIAKTGHALLNGDALTVLDWLDKPVDFGKLLKDITLIKQKQKNPPGGII